MTAVGYTDWKEVETFKICFWKLITSKQGKAVPGS